MSSCADCSDPLPDDGRFMCCKECKKNFHLRSSCSGISESTFISMGASKRDTWKCRHCRQGKNRPSAADASVTEELDALRSQIGAINQKLDSLSSLRPDINSLLSLPAKIDQLLVLTSTVDTLQSSVNQIQNSVSFMSTKYDDFLVRLEANEKESKQANSEVSALKLKVQEQETEIQSLKTEMNKQEQYSRRSNLEIHGLSAAPNEDLRAVAANLAKKLTIKDFDSSDILAIHRLPSKKKDNSPVVLIKFASVSVKETWMACRHKLQNLCETDTDHKLYFNENLTAANRELFWLARKKGKEKKYKYVWTKDGNVFAKKEEGASLIRVNDVNDLLRLT
ncbi:uncharacterized protein [Dermacentor albipictus]|uniref:uncharacterized protein n=1 Tax=Dermacentor albipictus TaxID=60249 RepID=UPI0038FCE35D